MGEGADKGLPPWRWPVLGTSRGVVTPLSFAAEPGGWGRPGARGALEHLAAPKPRSRTWGPSAGALLGGEVLSAIPVLPAPSLAGKSPDAVKITP